jgi:hypothetical protein
MGKGFPVDQIPADAHPTVLLFATGGSTAGIKLHDCCSSVDMLLPL